MGECGCGSWLVPGTWWHWGSARKASRGKSHLGWGWGMIGRRAGTSWACRHPGWEEDVAWIKPSRRKSQGYRRSWLDLCRGQVREDHKGLHWTFSYGLCFVLEEATLGWSERNGLGGAKRLGRKCSHLTGLTPALVSWAHWPASSMPSTACSEHLFSQWLNTWCFPTRSWCSRQSSCLP